MLSLIIAAIILYGTWGLLAGAIRLSFDAVPDHIDLAEVRRYLTGLEGVDQVHDLHIWAMSTTETALTAHLVMSRLPDSDQLLANTNAELHARFSIGHSTLQLEKAKKSSCGQHG